MKGMYILGPSYEVIEEPDPIKWAEWIETHTRRVGDDTVAGVRVSTVFMGLDIMADIMGRPPEVFETIIFGGPLDMTMRRYSSWDEAARGHIEMVARIKNTVN